MDQILENLQDPSWWFTGIFFLLVGILLTKALSSWLPKIWKSAAKLVPRITRRVQRWKERKILKRVKLYRQHQTEVIWLTTRFWSLMTLFTMYAGFLAISFSLSPEVADKSTEIKKLFPLVLPIYAFQLLIMWEQVILKRVRKAHIQWQKRITRRSSKDALNGAA
ncbi:hypothetical protein JKK33_14560 [Shewanella algae]|uniref:hypothetical protein n=1 Tax=Shewanella algae TaxID=38313 RepID=UPI001AACE37C|nr:hypothetical protein [Shewanella algae]QTE89594.1 hypothetical protein JKK33_14560 [Shewanella algae]